MCGTLNPSRRAVLGAGTALAAGTLGGVATAEPASWVRPVPVRAWVGARPATANRAPLHPQPLYQLPVGAVRPAGWLRRQLQIQANGLGGHLDETWDDAGPNSGWLGGGGESWERGPYFVDGLLPLAWLLDDPALKVKAQRWIDWTLDNTRPDGMFGPRQTKGENPSDDWWPRMVMLKVLMQYHELTEDPRVIPVMTRYFHHQLGALPQRPLQDWGMVRWQDNVFTALWLYNRTGDAKLIELAHLLEKQGANWQRLFADDYPYTKPYLFHTARKLPPPRAVVEADPTGAKRPMNPPLFAHGVNNGQALKVGPVWSVVSGQAQDRNFVFRQLAMLDRYHGQPNGMFSGSEHLAGLDTSQGTEVCTVVETLYSLECAMAVTGSAALGDRIETIAYNALPAGLSEDMWTHQYLLQPNQVESIIAQGPWTSNGPEANTFGLEPHFGCCTANFHQGWPKLVQSLWMASADGGLAATVYGPCSVDTIVRGVRVRIDQATDYPFRKSARITVRPDRAATFPLRLRVPAWSEGTSITVNGERQAAPVGDGFARIEREWRPGDVVEVAFAGEPRAVEGHNRSITYRDGALLFAMPVGEDWQKLRVRGLTADWQIRPTTPWAYAVQKGAAVKRLERPVGAVPFSRRDPPVVLLVDAYPVSGWTTTNGVAADVPISVAGRTGARPQRVTLMPFGAPKLRLTAFAQA